MRKLCDFIDSIPFTDLEFAIWMGLILLTLYFLIKKGGDTDGK